MVMHVTLEEKISDECLDKVAGVGRLWAGDD
jgi:hypothetical protein